MCSRIVDKYLYRLAGKLLCIPQSTWVIMMISNLMVTSRVNYQHLENPVFSLYYTMWNSYVQAAEVAQRRTAESSKYFQLIQYMLRQTPRVLPPCPFHLSSPLTVTFPKLAVILRPLYWRSERASERSGWSLSGWAIKCFDMFARTLLLLPLISCWTLLTRLLCSLTQDMSSDSLTSPDCSRRPRLSLVIPYVAHCVTVLLMAVHFFHVTSVLMKNLKCFKRCFVFWTDCSSFIHYTLLYSLDIRTRFIMFIVANWHQKNLMELLVPALCSGI
jgi:hypothetical protein